MEAVDTSKLHGIIFFFFNGSTALVGLGLLIYTRAVGLLERVISSSQGLYLKTRQHKHRKTHIHTLKHPCPQGGIRTLSHGLRAIEDYSCLRPLGYRDQRNYILVDKIFVVVDMRTLHFTSKGTGFVSESSSRNQFIRKCNILLLVVVTKYSRF
jgi:hypothetical protein